MAVPAPGYRVTTPFGKPGSWAAGFHTGDDYACPHRAKIVAARGGTVVYSGNGGGWGSAYGQHVIIDTNGRRHMYAHLDSRSVRYGQRVTEGQLIGYADNTGRSFGTHLHYEERVSPHRYGTDAKQPIFSKGTSGGGTTEPVSKCLGDYCFGKENNAHRALQRRLKEKGHDPGFGDWPTRLYGEGTRKAMAAFQRSLGWSGSDADGMPGPGTLDRLGLPQRLSYRRDKIVHLSKMKLGVGDSDSVWNVQIALLRRGYSIPAGPTDYFGNQTANAVKKFQLDQGWTGNDADGIPGPGTIRALGLNYVDDRPSTPEPEKPLPPVSGKPEQPSWLPNGVTWAPIQKADGSWVTGLRPFALLDKPAPKIILHTTESSEKPNWRNLGKGFPHFTADLDDEFDVDMHIPLDMAAFTLEGGAHSPNSAGGVTIQIEIVGFAKDTPNWSQVKCDRLKALLLLIAAQIDMPYVFPLPFTDDAGYGIGGEVRSDWETWIRVTGVVGHSHAPYNNHWDPGVLPVAKLTDRATEPEKPPVEPEVDGALGLLLANGWDEETQEEIDTALGVMFCESGGYVDAVGDIGIIDEKWGPSVGLGQIRTLQEVENWAGQPDGVRDIDKLRDPAEQVKAIRVLKNQYGWQQWSVHPDSADRKGRDPNGPEYDCFRKAKGQNFNLQTGHEKADCWSLEGCDDGSVPPPIEPPEPPTAPIVLFEGQGYVRVYATEPQEGE